MLGIGLGLTSMRGQKPSVLDRLSVAAAGSWSLRKMRNGYVGNAVRVRRSNDNAEADIGFKLYGARSTAYWVDETALLAHVGANSGFVTTWYDQSGNGRNLVQATAARQPQIVNSGVINSLGSFPTLSFGTNQSLDSAATGNVFIQEYYMYNCVFDKKTGGGGFPKLLGIAGGGGTGRFTYLLFDNPYTLYAKTGVYDFAASTNLNINTDYVYSFVRNNTTSTQYANGSSIGSMNNIDLGDSTSTNPFTIGAQGGSTILADVSEITVFSSGLSNTDRLILERNQGSTYGISIA
jgi:hypothetical protein